MELFSEDQIREAFGKYGRIQEVKIVGFQRINFS